MVENKDIQKQQQNGWQSDEILYSDMDIQHRIQQIHALLQTSSSTETKTRTTTWKPFPWFIRIPNLWAISSSIARSMDNSELLCQIVSPSVVSYIQTHGLYSTSTSSSTCNSKGKEEE